MSGAGRSSRVRKNPPASGMFEVSGPRPSFSSSSKFSGVRMPNSGGSVGHEVDVDHAVVLEVPADRQVLAHRHAEQREVVLRADPREHQQHRRLVGAGGEDHLALGADRLGLAVLDDLDADGTVAVEDDPLREHARAHLEVRPSGGRMEERVGGRSSACRSAA